MVTRSRLGNCLARSFQCKFLSNMPDVCNVSKTLGLSYSSQEEFSVVLNGGQIDCGKKLYGFYLDFGVQKKYISLQKTVRLMNDSV